MHSKIRHMLLRLQFNHKLRIRLFKKLVRFLNNSVPLIRALDILHFHASHENRKPKDFQAVIIDNWRRSVRSGKPFSEAIRGWVPEADRLVIEGGEKAGTLATAIEQAIEINRSVSIIRQAVIGGLAYPLVLLSALVGFMVLFGVRVIPEFETVLPRSQWTGTGAHMAIISDFVVNWLAYALAALAFLLLLVVWSLPRWKGRLRAKFDCIPPWSFYRLIMGTGFLLTVAGMLKSGIAVPRILSTMQRGANPYYRERLFLTAQNVKNGHNLGRALQLTGMNFPDREAIRDMRIYADLNRFNETLETMGRDWLNDSKEKIQRQSMMVRNVSIIVLGSVFMWISAGIFALQQQIASAL